MRLKLSVVGRRYKPKARALESALRKELADEAKTAKRELKFPTRTWSDKPEFEIEEITANSFSITTDNLNYARVNDGTKPHIIKPKRAKVLAFNSGFRSKTVPNKLISRAGASKPPTVFAKQVKHPGTKPRNFTKIVRERSEKRLAGKIGGAYKRVLR